MLRVTLQRRKRYKTTPIPGYRTLAVGQVNLSEVLRCSYVYKFNLKAMCLGYTLLGSSVRKLECQYVFEHTCTGMT